jgi:integrase
MEPLIMPRRALTAAAVSRLKPPKIGQVDHFDKGFPGLALRISYGGAKTWVYFYRLHGRQCRLTLGTWPAMELGGARAAWQAARTIVGKGENPARQRPAAADSFEAVADEWLKRDQAHNRSHDEVRRVIDRDVKPAWRGRQISTIGRRDVLELIDAIADRGAITLARRTHAHLHRLFRWSVGRGILEVNPMTDLPKPGAAVKRDRTLADPELALVWRAAVDTEWPFGPAIRLLILTAARRTEIGSLRWSEIAGDTIRLEGTRTKSGEPHSIPLAPQVVALIDGLPRVAGSDFVFTTTGRTAVSGWSKAKELLDKAVTDLNRGRPLPAWRAHDLRRTAATGLQRLGVSLQVIEAILGHVSGTRAGIVGVYQRHHFDDEKRAALEAWARHLEAVVSGRPSATVTPLRGRR